MVSGYQSHRTIDGGQGVKAIAKVTVGTQVTPNQQ
jgi:hypothetical protein